MSPWKDKTVVITGAAHGLGKALCKRLYDQGAFLILLDRDPSLHDIFTEETGKRVICGIVDISTIKEVYGFKQSVPKHFQNVDMLINNAGVSHTGAVLETDPSDFENVIRVNLLGSMYCVKAFLPMMLDRPKASIVNICSGIAFHGLPRLSAYATSKSALRTFSQSLRAELADTPVSVTTVYPGPMKTDIPLRSTHTHQSYRDQQVRYLNTKGYEPEDVAREILKKLERGKKEILIGWEVKTGAKIAQWSPGLLSFLLRKFPSLVPI